MPKLFSIVNYPNPFNPVTNINFNLTEDTFLNITIYDIMGRHINQIINGNQKAGHRSIKWNSTNSKGQPVSAGVYFFRIEAEGYIKTKKMILLK